MKPLIPVLPALVFLAACAGDNGSTRQSPPQQPRSVQSQRSGGPASAAFSHGRIYQITRLETADEPRGEWRAMGETIREQGSTISFVELGSGRPVSFTGSHQVTATNSMGDRSNVQGNSDNPNDVNQAPAR